MVTFRPESVETLCKRVGLRIHPTHELPTHARLREIWDWMRTLPPDQQDILLELRERSYMDGVRDSLGE